MNRNTRKYLWNAARALLTALLLALAGAAAAQAPSTLTTPDRVELPARLVQGLLLVPAEVDGQLGTFFFDSGAPTLVLNRREFGAGPAGESAGAQGVNGRMGSLGHYALGRLACQGLVLQNKEVPTLDLASLEQRLGSPLLGIIGADLLQAYAVTLDYRAGRVLLQKPGAPGAAPVAGVRVPFVLRGHLPVVAATVAGQPYQLGLDCGAQTNLLDAAAATTLKLKHRAQATLRGADAAGSQVLTADIPRLTLADGALVFRHQATTFADVGHLSRTPGAEPLQGLLGYPLLREYRATIDYVNKEVRFEKW